MKLNPLDKELEINYDSDSLVYKSDDEFSYPSTFNIDNLEDIKAHKMMVYGGYYHFENGWDTPKIFLLCRGKRSGKFKLEIQGFYPYCYDYSEKGEYKTYLGRNCDKIILYGEHPSMIARYRDNKHKKGYPIPLEADILFVRRFLMDVYDFFKPTELIQPRIAIVDIETNFPDGEDIIAFAINPQDGGDIYYESKYDALSREEFLQDLYDQIKEFDVIACWMGEDLFDLKVIESNFKKYGIPKLTEIVSVVDLLEVSHKMHGREIRGNWSLDNAGKRLCGIAKSLDEEDMKLYVKDLPEEKLFIYNVIDTVIPEIIDNYLGGLEGHLILAWSLQSMLDDVLITAVVNDIALLRAYHRNKQVLNSREYIESGDKTAKYKAAKPDARAGVYDGVIAYDLIHAYPSAVISLNISPETKDNDGEHIAPNKVKFNDNNSIFIDTLKDLMKERKKVKQELKKTEEGSDEFRRLKSIDFALKTQVAAFSHGIFGWGNSRMKDYETADAITAVVRDILDYIKITCDISGLKWIYCHTDSIYINYNKEDAKKTLDYLNEKIKNHCKDYKITPELEFKGFFPIGYIHSPARNVLVPEGVKIDDDENWDVTGMDFMRSECPEPIANIEVELIKLKLKKQSLETMTTRLKEMIKELPSKTSIELAHVKPFNKKIEDYGKLKLDGTLGGVPFHITALQRAQREYGLKVELKEKFGVLPIMTDEMVGIRKKKRKRVDMAFDLEDGLPNRYTIDFENYLDSNLFGKINDLFGLKTKELKELVKEVI